jgi:hypothetical protein
MRPLTLEFPNSLRDTLESKLSALKLQLDENESAPEEALEAIAFLYDEPAGTLEEKHFLRQFQQAMHDMVTGEGSPVLQFKNLPPTQGRLLTSMLMQSFTPILSNAETSLFDDTSTQLHHDSIFHFAFQQNKDVRSKTIRCLYCVNPGTPPVPTLFANADEILHYETCRLTGIAPGLDREAREGQGVQAAYEKKHDTLVGKMLASSNRHPVKVPATDAAGETSLVVHPALTFHEPVFFHNPNYNPETAKRGAPEYFLGNIYQQHNIQEMGERLRPSLRKHSSASTEANTAVIWNDALVVHDRDHTRGNGRVLVEMTSEPPYAGVTSPENKATRLPGQDAPMPRPSTEILPERVREQRYAQAMQQQNMRF